MRTDPRIDVYIAKAAPFAQPILRHLRKLIHAGCPEVGETLKWSSPFFVYRGKVLCFMPAFKAHLRFGFWNPEMRKLIAKEAGGLRGPITSLADLPDDQTLLRYVRTAAELQAAGKPARAKRPAKPRAPLRVPADLAAALRKNKKAAATFKDFSYSHRKEYTEGSR